MIQTTTVIKVEGLSTIRYTLGKNIIINPKYIASVQEFTHDSFKTPISKVNIFGIETYIAMSCEDVVKFMKHSNN